MSDGRLNFCGRLEYGDVNHGFIRVGLLNVLDRLFFHTVYQRPLTSTTPFSKNMASRRGCMRLDVVGLCGGIS